MLHKRLRKIGAAENAYAREIENLASLHLPGIIATSEPSTAAGGRFALFPNTQSNTRFIFTGTR